MLDNGLVDSMVEGSRLTTEKTNLICAQKPVNLFRVVIVFSDEITGVSRGGRL